jgi:large subunit ribosomal protein L18
MKKRVKKVRRKIRIRSKICGTKVRPRLSVFRSNKDIYGQLIDDKKGETLVTASGRDLVGNKTEKARLVGRLLAQKALKKGVKRVVFDRGSYRYHGRVKALAEGAREKGLKF